MKRFLPLIVFAASILGLPAQATPVLSGKYVYSWIEFCPGAGPTPTPSLSETSGLMTFVPATGKVSLTAQQLGGNPPVASEVGGSTTYSVTSTTLTIGSSTYKAYFGKVAAGITLYVGANGLYTGETPNCEDQFTLAQE
jgi:hypothetical protein